MRINDGQRREVAQELRELRHTTYYREEVVENICDAIRIADPVNTFREPEDVYKLLADLIDRPTCRLDLTDVETYGNLKVRIYECSKCGRTCEEIYGKYERCPHCGKEVLDA